MTDDLVQLSQDLSRRGEPFALATVVWRRAPSSAQPGNQAIVTAAGKVRGWLSGACAESVVIREARKALETGEPQLVLLGSPEELAARANDGISLVPMQCQSEGAIELFVQPVLPKTHLVMIRRTPMVGTLTSVAKALGLRTPQPRRLQPPLHPMLLPPRRLNPRPPPPPCHRRHPIATPPVLTTRGPRPPLRSMRSIPCATCWSTSPPHASSPNMRVRPITS